MEPLPQIDGPKLHVFPHHSQSLEFLQTISAFEQNAPDSGGDAHVFKVRIGGEDYALKVVRETYSSQK